MKQKRFVTNLTAKNTAPPVRTLSTAEMEPSHNDQRDDEKRTETNNFGKEDRGFSTEDQEENKAMNNDEFYFKRMPTNYGYKDMKKDVFA
ncbi:hypothetical protein ACROYT_G023839 [Oculina patagonica]